MKIKDLPIIKEDKRGRIYDCGDFKFISRKKGSVSANHAHNTDETLYLIDGRIELTIGDEKKTVEAPLKIEIPKNVYHKLLALASIKLIKEDKIRSK